MINRRPPSAPQNQPLVPHAVPKARLGFIVDRPGNPPARHPVAASLALALSAFAAPAFAAPGGFPSAKGYSWRHEFTDVATLSRAEARKQVAPATKASVVAAPAAVDTKARDAATGSTEVVARRRGDAERAPGVANVPATELTEPTPASFQRRAKEGVPLKTSAWDKDMTLFGNPRPKNEQEERQTKKVRTGNDAEASPVKREMVGRTLVEPSRARPAAEHREQMRAEDKSIPAATFAPMPLKTDAAAEASSSWSHRVDVAVQRERRPPSGAGAEVDGIEAQSSDALLRQRLNQGVLAAIERSPDLLQADAQRRAAESDADVAHGQRLPQVRFSGQSDARTFGGDPALNPPSTVGSLSLNVTTPVFDWGAGRKNEQSYRQQAQAAEQGYLSAREAIAQNVVNTMLELARYRAMASAADDYVKRMQTLVDMLGQIVEVDRGRRSEWSEAKARLLEATTGRDSHAARVRDLEIRLRILTGDDGKDLPPGDRWSLSQADLDGLLAGYRSHPAIQQAKATADAAETYAGAVKASARPRVDWVVNKSAYHDARGNHQPWATSLVLSWTLFNGGANASQHRAALARADASRHAAEVLERDYEYQIRSAVQTARDALARADGYRALTAEAEAVREAFFQQWYQLGKRSLLDVLSSETSLYSDRIGEISNRFDAYSAVVAAYAGAGQLTQWLAATGQAAATIAKIRPQGRSAGFALRR